MTRRNQGLLTSAGEQQHEEQRKKLQSRLRENRLKDKNRREMFSWMLKEGEFNSTKFYNQIKLVMECKTT